MTRKVAYLHTVLSVVPQFAGLARDCLPPGTGAMHIVDEMLAQVVLAQGGLSPFLYRRVADHARAAEEAGAGVLQLTCSSISPCVDVVQPLVGIPLLKIDEPMAGRAVAEGQNIGVAATAATSIAPTCDLIRARAAACGKSVQVDAVLCEGAYPYLVAGDMPAHDRVVRSYLEEMLARYDVVVLAQASMARVLDTIPAEARRVPVLTSPRLAMEHLAARLAEI